jgi:hypothetical protein
VVTAEELVEQLNVFIYHYSYVFEEGVKSKADYYSRMGWGGGCEKGAEWAENEWTKLTNPLRIHLIDFPPSWIVPFNGEHPIVIQRMIRDIGYRENPMIEEFLANKWKKFAKTGEYICDICVKHKRAQINKYQAAALILRKLMLPTDFQTLRADMAIFKAAIKMIGAK